MGCRRMHKTVRQQQAQSLPFSSAQLENSGRPMKHLSRDETRVSSPLTPVEVRPHLLRVHEGRDTTTAKHQYRSRRPGPAGDLGLGRYNITDVK